MITSYINGKYFDQPVISIFDLGFLRGYAVFVTLRTYEKQPFYLRRYLRSLCNSAANAHISLPKSFQEIEEIISILIKENGFTESIIRIILTKGISQDGIRPQGESSLIIVTSPVPENLIIPCLREGIEAITVSEARPIPQIKTLNYLRGIFLLEEAEKQGAREILYSKNNEILEGVTSNFFAIKENCLITASTDIFLGITRELLLEQAKDDFKIEIRCLKFEEIEEIEEAFTSSSIRGIAPIVSINQKRVGSGSPGPKTAWLADLFRQLTLTPLTLQ